MLAGLSKPMKSGESVPLKLYTLDTQGKEPVIELSAAVKDVDR
jgi:hypothetical protein